MNTGWLGTFLDSQRVLLLSVFDENQTKKVVTAEVRVRVYTSMPPQVDFFSSRRNNPAQA